MVPILLDVVFLKRFHVFEKFFLVFLLGAKKRELWYNEEKLIKLEEVYDPHL